MAGARYIKGELGFQRSSSLADKRCSAEFVEDSAEEDDDVEEDEQPDGDENEEGPGESLQSEEERSVDKYV